MKKFLLLFAALFTAVSMWAIEQDADGNYLIGSADDWKAFAEIVNTTPTANAKMTADIDLGEEITIIGNSYAGVFDGQGHQLDFQWEVNYDNRLPAPFSTINCATIKNLALVGKINTSILLHLKL